MLSLYNTLNMYVFILVMVIEVGVITVSLFFHLVLEPLKNAQICEFYKWTIMAKYLQ